MTRAEQLAWYRQGYEAGRAAAVRELDDQAVRVHLAEVAEFRTRRREDQQAPVDALLLEVVDVLARAMLGEDQAEDTGPVRGAA